MLSRYLQQANCQVYHSTADADLLIVDKAVGSSRTMDTVLDGDDTDLLILLCYHAELDILDLFFPTRIKSKFQASILEYKISEEKAWPRDLSSHSFYPCYQTEWMRSDLWIVWNLQRSSTKEVCQRYPLS